MAMTRQRYIRPELFRDEDLASLSPEVRLTAIGLHLYTDDEGRESATPAMVKAALWPLDSAITEDVVDTHLLELAEIGYLRLYAVGRRSYLQLAQLARVDRAKASTFPPPPPLASDSRMNRDPLAVVEGEGERVREGEWAWEREGREEWRDEEGAHSRPPLDSSLPSPFCRAHPGGTMSRCRNCGTARLAHEQAVRASLATHTEPRRSPGYPRFEDEG
ncbi:hypothetical protein [Mycetocola saprophilus]|uniref:hypothetical protein n=1 Tax=Mycetocola saprophilus TaxID=76636 RepID=UPI0012DE12B7|nr:hypothetical protein [Mycetocola saprophilus]